MKRSGGVGASVCLGARALPAGSHTHTHALKSPARNRQKPPETAWILAGVREGVIEVGNGVYTEMRGGWIV